MSHHLNAQRRLFPTDGQPGRDWFQPLTGWLLTAFVNLDEDLPGILRFAVMSRSSLWRNAVAVALASGALERPESFLLRAHGELAEEGPRSARALFAEALQTMQPQQIVEASLTEEIPSIMGSLKKIGWEPLTSPDAYCRLIDLLGSTTVEGRARRRVLEQSGGRLSDDSLQVIWCLDLAILSPLVASQIGGAAEARRLNARLSVIRQMCSGATDEALRASANALGSRFNSGQFARSWLSKADRLEPLGIPLDRHPDIIRINPAKCDEFGRRFRNCMAGFASDLAAGLTAFFVVESLSVIVVVRLTDLGWMLTGVHAHANGPVPRKVLEEVKERLGELGVLCALPVRPTGDIALVTGAFSRFDDLDFGLNGMDIHD